MLVKSMKNYSPLLREKQGEGDNESMILYRQENGDNDCKEEEEEEDKENVTCEVGS